MRQLKRDCYDILGVPKDADEKAIKRAYRKLAKLYHPDTNAGNEEAQKKFKEVGEAYNILSDPEKKEIYDQYGWEAFQNGADPKAYRDARQAWEQQRAADADGTSYRTWHFSGDGSDAGGFGSIFEDLFGGKGGSRSSSWEGNPFGFGSGNPFGSGAGGNAYDGFGASPAAYDQEASITVSFEEAVYGCTKTVRLGGQAGGGKDASTVQISIPAGIEDGKKLRLRGKGAPKPGGGNGDLYIRVDVREKPGFTRKGRDIYTEAEIPFVTAALGGEAKLPTLNGQVLCRIPAGTQSGKKIRLKGKGVPSGKNQNASGDEYVTIRIQVPKTLTPEETQALREFERVSQGRN